jgi:hypothetical protein
MSRPNSGPSRPLGSSSKPNPPIQPGGSTSVIPRRSAGAVPGKTHPSSPPKPISPSSFQVSHVPPLHSDNHLLLPHPPQHPLSPPSPHIFVISAPPVSPLLWVKVPPQEVSNNPYPFVLPKQQNVMFSSLKTHNSPPSRNHPWEVK